MGVEWSAIGSSQPSSHYPLEPPPFPAFLPPSLLPTFLTSVPILPHQPKPMLLIVLPTPAHLTLRPSFFTTPFIVVHHILLYHLTIPPTRLRSQHFSSINPRHTPFDPPLPPSPLPPLSPPSPFPPPAQSPRIALAVALAVGKTVADAFAIARECVRACPSLRRTEAERLADTVRVATSPTA